MILTRSRSDARPPADAENCFAFLGGVERRIRSADYRGGSATAFMGGVRIDLTEADMAGDRAVVHVFAMWGSIEIHIPDTWAIEVGVVPIMGGVVQQSVSLLTPRAVLPHGRHQAPFSFSFFLLTPFSSTSPFSASLSASLHCQS